jgi:hypothetical protein
MSLKRLEEVFKISGVPTFTFVEPTEYNDLKVALRTPGRGVVLEGPSGIGKSTAVTRALAEIVGGPAVTKLSARVPTDLDYISLLPELSSFGFVVVDDFHRLPHETRERLADLLKTLADVEATDRKLVIVGINQAGYSLVQHAPDLVNRVDRIRFEIEPSSKVEQLMSQGEEALNIVLEARRAVVDAADGSFYLTQLLCHNLCVQAGVLGESVGPPAAVSTLYAKVRRNVLERQETRFGKAVRAFVRGPKFRPSGRAPYLHILRWLTDSAAWSIDLREEMARHPSERISVAQVVDKGYLENLVTLPDIAAVLHFDRNSKVLSVEDPQLIYYLRNLDWGNFARTVGFTRVDFPEAYDVALTFAGEDRPFAEAMRDHLEGFGHTVFYDFAEQHRILAQDVEAYLAPIYRSGSRYVVAVLGPRYGEKRWTLFEADQYKDRVSRGKVIPIWSKVAPVGAFDNTRSIGGLQFDPAGDLEEQAAHASAVISKKLADKG